MNRPWLAALVFLVVFPASAQQPPDWALVHSLTVQGIDQLYDMRVEEARATFHRIIALAPGDPRGYFFRSMIHFWLYSLERNEVEYDRFIASSDTVIEVCESVLDSDDRNASARFFLGGIHGYRGLAMQGKGSIVKAVYEGRAGYKELTAALEVDSTLYDAQMGVGLFRCLVSRAPKAFSWVLKVIGFDGDMKGGLASLRIAAEKGLYARPEAMLFLAEILPSENQHEEAMRYLHQLTSRYPNNTLFLVTESSLHRRAGDFAGARTSAERAVALYLKRNQTVGEEIAFTNLAWLQFIQDDFAGTAASYARLFSRTPSPSFLTNQVYHRNGICLEILGDRAGAVASYRRATPVEEKDRENERFLFRRCQDRAGRAITASEILVIKGDNARSRKQPVDAQHLYEQAALEAGGDHDRKAEAVYRLANVLLEQSNYAGAIQNAQRVLAEHPQVERWLEPQAWLLLGKAYAQSGDKAKAREALEKVDEYDGYDFQKSTEDSAKEELKRL